MAETTVSLKRASVDLKSGSSIVGKTNRVYPIQDGRVVFDEVQVLGDLSGVLTYNGRKLKIVRVDELIGLLVDGKGMRGPVWRGVECEAIG